MVQEVSGAGAVQVAPPGLVVAVYSITAEPPVSGGVVQETKRVPLPAVVKTDSELAGSVRSPQVQVPV